NAGGAYVFVRSGTDWSQQAQLIVGDGAAEDHFGNAVALSGDTALVGALYDDTVAGADTGSACVFVRGDTNWSQQTQLTAGNAGAADHFAWSVALSGNTALVGTPS